MYCSAQNPIICNVIQREFTQIILTFKTGNQGKITFKSLSIHIYCDLSISLRGALPKIKHGQNPIEKSLTVDEIMCSDALRIFWRSQDERLFWTIYKFRISNQFLSIFTATLFEGNLTEVKIVPQKPKYLMKWSRLKEFSIFRRYY